jgi:hypothetical protein
MEEGADVLAETDALEEEGDESHGVPQEGVVAPVLVNVAVAASQGSQDVYPSEAAAFKIFKNFEKIDFDLVVGNNQKERFADVYRMAQMSELDREAELAKRHDARKARQDMQKLQEQQRQVDRMRASVAEQTKRREVEALRASNQVSFRFCATV